MFYCIAIFCAVQPAFNKYLQVFRNRRSTAHYSYIAGAEINNRAFAAAENNRTTKKNKTFTLFHAI
jgi:hypothetical protein